MLDSTQSKSSHLLGYHHNSSSSASASPYDHQAIIRNAIASDSQRIRVQDETTGKSYELRLGKGVPYPERFGEDGDTSMTQDADAGSSGPTAQSSNSTAAAFKKSIAHPASAVAPSSSSSSAPVNGRANGTSKTHRLRPFFLSKGRTSPSQPNDATADEKPSVATSPPPETAPLQQPAQPSTTDNRQRPQPNGAKSSQPLTQPPTHSSASSSSSSNPQPPLSHLQTDARAPQPRSTSVGSRPSAKSSASLSTAQGGVQLQQLNRKYHEDLAAKDANVAAKRLAAPKGRDRRPSSSSSARTTPAVQNVAHSQYTAPARHYPIMSELPPSPPLENDFSKTSDGPLGQLNGSIGPEAASSGHTKTNSLAAVPKLSSRSYSAASTASAYMSAEEDFVDAEASQSKSPKSDTTWTEEPSTPKAKIPRTIVTASPDMMDSSPRPGRSSPPVLPTIRRTMSNGSNESQQPPRSSTSGAAGSNVGGPTSTGAGLVVPAPAARRNRSLPAREGIPRRNTVGSNAMSSSLDSAEQRLPSSSANLARQTSRDKWAATNGQPDGEKQAGAIVRASTLKTGDADLDEEVAKAEAAIRKRKERARREEEERAQAARGVEDEPTQEQVIKEQPPKEKAMPALLRGKSGLGLTVQTGKTPQVQQNAKDFDQAKLFGGNIINESHVNFTLMYHMLTGIRIGVSRCQARQKRALQPGDYQAKNKFTFDIIGNELTPQAGKYDFKFKDYAPWVFRELREYFHLDPADYLVSLTSKYVLSELGSPGKSGSFFYFSSDYRFIIKTIRHSEHKFLRKILKDYHEHVMANPHTLLSRFYGLHRVKLQGGRKIHFVIMNNLFPPHKDIHETYDLKGSSYGREYPEEKAKKKKGATLKDINWIRRRRELELGPQKRSLFEAQLESDVALLKRLSIMDYSLLIGLHDVKRGNSENLRQEKLQVVDPPSAAAAAAGKSKDGFSPVSPSSTGVQPLWIPHHAHVTERPLSPTNAGDSQIPMKRTGSSMTVASHESAFVDAPNRQQSLLSPSSSVPLGITPGEVAETMQSPPANSGAFLAPEGGDGGMSNSTSSGSIQGASGKAQRPPSSDAFALRAAVRRSDPKALGTAGAQLPERETSDRRHFLFYQDSGGFQSTDENNSPTEWIYYLGIIDLFTPFSSIKRGENWWKSLTQDGRKISAVPPRQYGERFAQFLKAVTRPMKWSELPPGFEGIKTMSEYEEEHEQKQPTETEKVSAGH